MSSEPRFLIARLSALGDTVCSLPVAVALKRAFPACRITWAVDPRFAGIVECCSAVDEIVRVKPSIRNLPTFEGRFTAALDLQGLLKSAICVARAKADQKLGYQWQREGASFFSSRVLPDPSSHHVVDQYVDVARALGAEMDRAEFGLAAIEEDVLRVRRKLKEREVYGRFVVINAGAGWTTKKWPPAHFAAVIEVLAERGFASVLVGSKSEGDRIAATEVSGHCQKPFASLLGETSVRELVALIRLCSAHLGGDTGSSHIAAALGIPAIGLYGVTRPQRSCPYGQFDRCHYDPSGLANVRPAAVLETLEAALA